VASNNPTDLGLLTLNPAELAFPEFVIDKTMKSNYEFDAYFNKVTKTIQMESASVDPLMEDSPLSQLVAQSPIVQAKLNAFLGVIPLMMKYITKFNLPANDQVYSHLSRELSQMFLFYLSQEHRIVLATGSAIRFLRFLFSASSCRCSS
jgi:hypothetical protein